MRTFHVALLRGINVGGNHVIKMDALRAAFERLGFTDVATYIASGNVVFGAEAGDSRALEQKIERALAAEFAYDGKVVVRSAREYGAMMKAVPGSWGQNPKDRHYVLFLRDAIDSKAVLAQFEVNQAMEEIRYVPGAVLWCARIDQLTRSRVNRFVMNKKLYLEVTARNWNTTRKIAGMLPR